MSNKKDIKLMAFILSAMFWGSGAYANDVYIEQAGDTSEFTITQLGTGNRVGSSGTSSTFSGNSQAINITQDGSSNTADLIVSGGSTTLTYSAVGSTNDLQLEIGGGSGNTFDIAKNGDSNRVTVCGTNNIGGAVTGGLSGTQTACSTGVAVNDTANTINISGDSNSVNLALDSPNAVNTINIGHTAAGTATTASSGNIVNLTQSGATATQNVNLAITGDTNTVNITQSQ
jgi:hypothetical protein